MPKPRDLADIEGSFDVGGQSLACAYAIKANFGSGGADCFVVAGQQDGLIHLPVQGEELIQERLAPALDSL